MYPTRIITYHTFPFCTRWRSWLRCCATSRKVTGSIPDGAIGIFYWHSPSGRTISLGSTQPPTEMSRLRFKCDGTPAETRFILSAKRTNPFKWAGASVQLTTCSRDVRISGIMLDKPCSEVVWRVLATHFILQFPLHFPSLRHRVPPRFNWTLPEIFPRGNKAGRCVGLKTLPP